MIKDGIFPPARQIRASYGPDWVHVYQAYSPAIARLAIRSQTFVPPFRTTRMTWIKPSFLWMMYRSGWGQRPGQEHILRIKIKRCGFDWAIGQAVLTHFEPSAHAARNLWEEQQRRVPVLVQWDPERDLTLKALPYRTIQIGLRNEAVRHYVAEWLLAIEDVTDLARQIHSEVVASQLDSAKCLISEERPYPVAPEVARKLGMIS